MRASSQQGYRLATPPLLSFCRSSIPPPVSVHAVSRFLIGTPPSILRPYLTARPTIFPIHTPENGLESTVLQSNLPEDAIYHRRSHASRSPEGHLLQEFLQIQTNKKREPDLIRLPRFIRRCLPRCRPAAPQAPCAGCPESARPAPRRSPAHSRPRSQ